MGQTTGVFYWMAETSSIDGRRGKRFLFALSVIKNNIESAIVGTGRMKKLMKKISYDYRLPSNAFFAQNYATL